MEVPFHFQRDPNPRTAYLIQKSDGPLKSKWFSIIIIVVIFVVVILIIF